MEVFALEESTRDSIEARERYTREVEVGNVEYKLKLIDPTPTRFEQLITQLKWRLTEGGGEAIYEIGVEDDGLVRGLTDGEMAESLATLRRMCDRLDARMVRRRHCLLRSVCATWACTPHAMHMQD